MDALGKGEAMTSDQLPARLVAGNPIKGIIPTDFESAWRIGSAAVAAGYAPLAKSYGKPEPSADDQKAAATMIIMAGLELGLPPTQALETIAIINGRRSIYGDGIPALLWSHGFDLEEWTDGEGDSFTAYCTVTRPNGKKITRKFSVADAKQARLWDERDKVTRKDQNGSYTVDNDSPWFKYGKSRMLPMRARGWAARDGAADVLRGLHIAEEQLDMARERAPDAVPLKARPVPVNNADLPDIPDEAPASQSPTSQSGVQDAEVITDIDQAALIRQIERELEANPEEAADIELRYQTSIINMDEDGRGIIVEAIQEAKRIASKLPA